MEEKIILENTWVGFYMMKHSIRAPGLPDSRAAQDYNFANFPSGPEYGSYMTYTLTFA